MTHRGLVVASLLLPASLLAAQSERLTVRLAPTPNQTIHLRATQDMLMTLEADAPAAGARPLPPMDMHMQTVIDSTSAVGPSDADGRYAATVTIDNMSATMAMNGKETPVPAALSNPAARPVITFSYDDQGKVTDISTGDSATPNPAADMAKQILTRAMATAAPMTLSVGETTTVPAAFDLAMPAAGTVTPLGIKGETRYTLTSVTFDGADRIAHLTSHSTGTMTQAPTATPAAPAAPLVNFDMTMTTDGKSDVNVDRGVVVHSEQRSTLDGRMRLGATAAAVSNMRMHATFTIASDVVK